MIFSNIETLNIDEVEVRLLRAFLPDKQFIASQISIPEKFLFANGDFSNHDHCFHEFDSAELCEDTPTDSLERTIANFLQEVETVSKQGWKAFDILDRA